MLSTTGPFGRVIVTEGKEKPLGVERTAGAEPRKVATPAGAKSRTIREVCGRGRERRTLEMGRVERGRRRRGHLRSSAVS